MEKLYFYKINSSYLTYLCNRQPKVRLKATRAYVGVVLKIDEINYFAPLCSPKEKILTWSDKKIDVFLIDRGKLGFIDFSNMIPVKKKLLIPIYTKTLEDKNYARLVSKQYSYINKEKETIYKKAHTVYRLKKTGNRGFKQCLDFCELEKLLHKFK